MMKTIRLLLAVFSISLFSCQEEVVHPYEGDYLVFGNFYGECLEECVSTFRLEENRLIKDTQAQRIGQSVNFEKNPQVLSQDNFELAQELLTIFPSQLLTESDSTFGCPDCYDQGGLYIEYQQGDEQGVWIIDQTQEDVPAYLHEFMDRVNETIQLLQ